LTNLTFGTLDTLQELVLTFTVGSPTLQKQGAFARAQAATCETDGHRVRVIVLLRDLLRDIQDEEAQASPAAPHPSAVLPTIPTAPPLVLGKRSRASVPDGDGGETTQVAKRARSIAQREASEVVVELQRSLHHPKLPHPSLLLLRRSLLRSALPNRSQSHFKVVPLGTSIPGMSYTMPGPLAARVATRSDEASMSAWLSTQI